MRARTISSAVATGIWPRRYGFGSSVRSISDPFCRGIGGSTSIRHNKESAGGEYRAWSVSTHQLIQRGTSIAMARVRRASKWLKAISYGRLQDTERAGTAVAPTLD